MSAVAGMRWAAAVVLVVALGADAERLAAQSVRAAVAPDTVRVGDVFHAALRIDLPPGYTVHIPDSLDVDGQDLEPAGRRRDRLALTPDGERRITTSYPLTAWRPGAVELPPVRIRFNGPDGQRMVDVAWPALSVRSVLPLDRAGIEPRPARGVLGGLGGFGVARLLAVLAAILALLALLGWLWSRRAPASGAAPGPARERALAELARLREDRLAERGEVLACYVRLSGILRRYLAELRPEWSADRTTAELLRAMQGVALDGQRGELARILGDADLVKFAGRRPAGREAMAAGSDAAAWLREFQEPAGPEPARDAAPEAPAAGGSAGARRTAVAAGEDAA